MDLLADVGTGRIPSSKCLLIIALLNFIVYSVCEAVDAVVLLAFLATMSRNVTITYSQSAKSECAPWSWARDSESMQDKRG